MVGSKMEEKVGAAFMDLLQDEEIQQKKRTTVGQLLDLPGANVDCQHCNILACIEQWTSSESNYLCK